VIFNYNRSVYISIVDYNGVYPYDCGVIAKTAFVPIAAVKPFAPVTVAIVNTAIITYIISPIARIESINPVYKCPVRRCP
jgi:hypothetical protein